MYPLNQLSVSIFCRPSDNASGLRAPPGRQRPSVAKDEEDGTQLCRVVPRPASTALRSRCVGVSDRSRRDTPPRRMLRRACCVSPPPPTTTTSARRLYPWVLIRSCLAVFIFHRGPEPNSTQHRLPPPCAAPPLLFGGTRRPLSFVVGVCVCASVSLPVCTSRRKSIILFVYIDPRLCCRLLQLPS